jgi:hypothetical protein
MDCVTVASNFTLLVGFICTAWVVAVEIALARVNVSMSSQIGRGSAEILTVGHWTCIFRFRAVWWIKSFALESPLKNEFCDQITLYSPVCLRWACAVRLSDRKVLYSQPSKRHGMGFLSRTLGNENVK